MTYPREKCLASHRIANFMKTPYAQTARLLGQKSESLGEMTPVLLAALILRILWMAHRARRMLG
jgi:hypothetical protein